MPRHKLTDEEKQISSDRRKEYLKQWAEDNKEKLRVYAKSRYVSKRVHPVVSQYNLRSHLRGIFFSNIVCSNCGFEDTRALQYHHVNPSNKVSSISDMIRDCESEIDIRRETLKCIVLCANCHVIVTSIANKRGKNLHAGITKLYKWYLEYKNII